jgi:hypothetical protein
VVEGEVFEGVGEHVDELGAPPPMPRLRSLALAFLVGALVVSGWSFVRQWDRADGAQRAAIQRCEQWVTDQVGHAVGLDEVEARRGDGAWTVTGVADGRGWKCRVRPGQLSDY